jgi:nicotinate-nucleotide--dimethylbenzimidazole phosphoribosyltransferase
LVEETELDCLECLINASDDGSGFDFDDTPAFAIASRFRPRAACLTAPGPVPVPAPVPASLEANPENESDGNFERNPDGDTEAAPETQAEALPTVPLVVDDIGLTAPPFSPPVEGTKAGGTAAMAPLDSADRWPDPCVTTDAAAGPAADAAADPAAGATADPTADPTADAAADPTADAAADPTADAAADPTAGAFADSTAGAAVGAGASKARPHPAPRARVSAEPETSTSDAGSPGLSGHAPRLGSGADSSLPAQSLPAVRLERASSTCPSAVTCAAPVAAAAEPPPPLSTASTLFSSPLAAPASSEPAQALPAFLPDSQRGELRVPGPRSAHRHTLHAPSTAPLEGGSVGRDGPTPPVAVGRASAASANCRRPAYWARRFWDFLSKVRELKSVPKDEKRLDEASFIAEMLALTSVARPPLFVPARRAPDEPDSGAGL